MQPVNAPQAAPSSVSPGAVAGSPTLWLWGDAGRTRLRKAPGLWAERDPSSIKTPLSLKGGTFHTKMFFSPHIAHGPHFLSKGFLNSTKFDTAFLYIFKPNPYNQGNPSRCLVWGGRGGAFPGARPDGAPSLAKETETDTRAAHPPCHRWRKRDMKEKRGGFRTIRAKIVCIVLGISILALLLSAAASSWGMGRIRATALESSEALGQMAATDSQTALVSQATGNLLTEVSAKAQLTEERLEVIRDRVALLAAYVTPLWNEETVIADSRAPVDKKRGMQYDGMPEMAPAVKAEQAKRAEQLRYLLEPVCLDNDSISSVYLATPEGFMLSYDANVGDDLEQMFREGYDFRTREWYLSASAGEIAFTSTYLDVFGRLMTTCSAPVYGADGRLVGVLGMDILIDDINESVVSAQVGEAGYAFLIDKAGTVISAPDLKADAAGNYETVDLLADADFGPSVERMITGARNITQLTVDGEEVFLAFAPVSITGWSLGMVLPRDEVVAPALASRDHILEVTQSVQTKLATTMAAMLLVFAAVLAAVLAFVLTATGLLSKKLTAPIHQLIEEVGVISGGDLDHRVEVHTGDEMERLGMAFNGMTERLGQYIQDLTAVTAEKERIGAELSVATHIQASMLPCIFPPFPDRTEFDIFATMTPAKEVGGDFYDFFLVDDDHLAMVIADVSGKGVPAALFMVIAKTLIKDHDQTGAPLERVFGEVNQQLCESNDEGMFVTAWMAVLELSTGHVTYVNAGHNPPLVCRGEDYTYLKLEPGFVLAGLEGMQYVTGELTLGVGDTLYLYTDGVTEAVNGSEELYGEARLKAVLDSHAGSALTELLTAVKADIDAFADEAPQFDDITMLGVTYLGRSDTLQ